MVAGIVRGRSAVSIQLQPVPATALAANWVLIEPLMKSLAEVSNGRLSVGDIVRAIDLKNMQLWAAKDETAISLMLTEILKHPQQKDLHIISATGQNADHWMSLFPKFEEWAIAEKCAVITATCRLGWKKLLEPAGFKEVSCVLEKRL